MIIGNRKVVRSKSSRLKPSMLKLNDMPAPASHGREKDNSGIPVFRKLIKAKTESVNSISEMIKAFRLTDLSPPENITRAEPRMGINMRSPVIIYLIKLKTKTIIMQITIANR